MIHGSSTSASKKREEKGEGEINKMLRSVCSDQPAAGLMAGAGEINNMDAALHCWKLAPTGALEIIRAQARYFVLSVLRLILTMLP